MPRQNRELRSELATLARADRDIAAGEDRLRQQIALTAQIRDRGGDTAVAERLVQMLRATLVQWEAHRNLIRDRISYLQRQEGAAPAARPGRRPSSGDSRSPRPPGAGARGTRTTWRGCG